MSGERPNRMINAADTEPILAFTRFKLSFKAMGLEEPPYHAIQGANTVVFPIDGPVESPREFWSAIDPQHVDYFELLAVTPVMAAATDREFEPDREEEEDVLEGDDDEAYSDSDEFADDLPYWRARREPRCSSDLEARLK